MVQLFRGSAHDLENNLYGALLPVITGNGQRNPFAFGVHPKNDKLSGLRFAGPLSVSARTGKVVLA